MVNAEVLLPQNGEHMKATRVIGRSKKDDGSYIGQYDSNPILDTRIFNVKFPDGETSAHDANTIRQNIFSQVDEEDHRYHTILLTTGMITLLLSVEMNG